MLGAVVGDIVGSRFEHAPIKSKQFDCFTESSTFTDDTVMSAAIAEAILSGRSYQDAAREVGSRYPSCGYGQSFFFWLFMPKPQPYNSWGNGSAMRVSPIGWAFDGTDEVLEQAKQSAEFTHNHPEGIKGAQATALAIYLARTGWEREAIRAEIEGRFGYRLDTTVDRIRPGYAFDVSCQGTVPQALVAFLDSTSFEDAVRNAVSLGGDSDTLACITGSIAEPFYGGIPAEIANQALSRLTPDLLHIVSRFRTRFCGVTDTDNAQQRSGS